MPADHAYFAKRQVGRAFDKVENEIEMVDELRAMMREVRRTGKIGRLCINQASSVTAGRCGAGGVCGRWWRAVWGCENNPLVVGCRLPVAAGLAGEKGWLLLLPIPFYDHASSPQPYPTSYPYFDSC